MYAVIEDSGTQLKVSEGDLVRIDPRELDDAATSVTFDRVLMVGGDSPKIGAPYVDGAAVEAEIVNPDIKGEKIDVIKFKRRKGYRRKQGHRQHYMSVRVTSIKG